MIHDRSQARRGFTLIELLVVIGIIAALLAILLPALGGLRRQAAQARVRMDFQAISTALEAYKQDFGDYPRYPDAQTTNQGGRHILAMALMGPDPAVDSDGNGPLRGDGADGYGFRLEPGGKVYGPYLSPEKFKVQILNKDWRLLDYRGNAISYYPAKRRTANLAGTPIIQVRNNSGNLPAEFAGDNSNSLFCKYDGSADPLFLLWALGDRSLTDSANPYKGSGVFWDNRIRGSEKLACELPYMLHSAGADDTPWALADVVGQSVANGVKEHPCDASWSAMGQYMEQILASLRKCDDVMNFDYER